MELKERIQEAIARIANELSRPWFKRSEYWIGILVNLIAFGAPLVAIIFLWAKI